MSNNGVSQDFSGLSIHPGDDEFALESPPPPPPPPPPLHSNSGIVAIDITADFHAAAQTLAPGELVKSDGFTLFESVAALEIMDPKMDSGCLADGETLEDEYDVSRPLLPTEVLGIIDQLLCLEMAWHLGYPLSQTLLTSVYVEAILMPEPTTIGQANFVRAPAGTAEQSPVLAVLRAYCLGLLKSCYYVNESIKREHFYEEEDFVTNTYHRSMLEKIDLKDIRSAIQDARELARGLEVSVPDDVIQALDFRLEFRYAFLRVIELAELRCNPSSMRLPWTHVAALWEQINKSHSLALDVPESFSTKLQRQLASTIPPRPIVQLAFDETHNRFQRFFVDGQEVNGVLEYVDSQSLLNFVMAFQARKPQPLVYIRTLLQYFLFKDMVILGRFSMRNIIDDDLSLVVLPCSHLLDHANDDIEAVHDPRFAISHQMESFRERAMQTYFDVFRTFCQNRCRVRRTLCHMIQDWEGVQVLAEEIDQLLQHQLEEKPFVYQTMAGQSDPSYSMPLSSWAYLYKLRQMEWIVQLGFELDIYQPDELALMYWYLGYLAKIRTQHGERIKAFILRSLNEQRSHFQTFTSTREAQFTRSLSYMKLTVLEGAITWELADALASLYTVISRLGLLKRRSQPYSSDQLRYEVRMKPFAAIGLPELPSFSYATKFSSRPEASAALILKDADRCIAGTKKIFETFSKLCQDEVFRPVGYDKWVAETSSIKKSVILAGIGISTLRKALSECPDGRLESKFKVEIPPPQEGYHEWWIVPKITKTP